MGWGIAFLFAQSSLFRIVTHQMLIVFVIYSWGAAAPPDLCLWGCLSGCLWTCLWGCPSGCLWTCLWGCVSGCLWTCLWGCVLVGGLVAVNHPFSGLDYALLSNFLFLIKRGSKNTKTGKQHKTKHPKQQPTT